MGLFFSFAVLMINQTLIFFTVEPLQQYYFLEWVVALKWIICHQPFPVDDVKCKRNELDFDDKMKHIYLFSTQIYKSTHRHHTLVESAGRLIYVLIEGKRCRRCFFVFFDINKFQIDLPKEKKIIQTRAFLCCCFFLIWSRLNFIRERDKRAMKSKSQLLALTAWLTVWRTQWEFIFNKTLFIEKSWNKNEWDQHFCWICAIVVDTVQSINKEKNEGIGRIMRENDMKKRTTSNNYI